MDISQFAPDEALTRAKEFQERRFFDEAIVWYKSAAERGNIEANGRLGELLYKLKKVKEAKKYLIFAAKNGDVIGSIAYGGLLLDSGKVDQGKTILENLIKNENVEAMIELGKWYMKTKQFKKGAYWLQLAVENGSFSAFYSLVDLYIETSEVNQLNELLKLLTNFEDPVLTREIADKLFVEGLFELAEPLYVQIKKSSPEVLCNLGMIYWENNQLSMAKDSFQSAIELGEKNSLYNLGMLLIESGEEDQGIKLLERAAEGEINEAELTLGMLLADNQPFTALDWLEKAKNHNVDGAEELYNKLDEKLRQKYSRGN